MGTRRFGHQQILLLKPFIFRFIPKKADSRLFIERFRSVFCVAHIFVLSVFVLHFGVNFLNIQKVVHLLIWSAPFDHEGVVNVLEMSTNGHLIPFVVLVDRKNVPFYRRILESVFLEQIPAIKRLFQLFGFKLVETHARI